MTSQDVTFICELPGDLPKRRLDEVCPSAPKKLKKCGPCDRQRMLGCVVRRPEDFIVSPAACPPYHNMLAIGSQGQYVVVKTHNDCLNVCIRHYFFKEILQRWLPSRTGLNLTFDEWRAFRSYRNTMLIMDALRQEMLGLEPEHKGNQMHELECPTSWPETTDDGTNLHKIEIGGADGKKKFVVVSKLYSPFDHVMVSFLEFPENSVEPLRGIHLCLSAWRALESNLEDLDKLVEDEQLKLDSEFAASKFY